MNSKAVGCVVGLSLLSACGRSPSVEPGWAELKPTGLPAIVGSGDCDPEPAMSGCDWALSADEIVWGSVQAIRLVDSPAVLMGGPNVGSLTTTCNGIVESAMELDIATEQTLKGSLSGVVTVRVGALHRYKFDPHPIRGPAGSIFWESWQAKAAGEPLEIGQKVGAAFYRLPTGEFSLMGQPLLGVGLDDAGKKTIRFQKALDGCGPASPTEFAGMSIGGVKSFIQGCPLSSPTGDKLRRRHLIPLEFPQFADQSEFRAARCWPNP